MSSLVTSSSGTNMCSTADVLNLIHKFQMQSIYTDVTIVVGGQRFQAHLVVLCAVSPVFRKMFSSEMKEEKTRVVEIEDVDPSTFEIFLDYCYSGEIGRVGDIGELLMLFDKYDVGLTPECIMRMVQMLDVEDVLNYLVAADLYRQVDLRNAVFSFLKDNRREVLWQGKWKSDRSKLVAIIGVLSRVECSGKCLFENKVEWNLPSELISSYTIYEGTLLIPYQHTMILMGLQLLSDNTDAVQLYAEIKAEKKWFDCLALKFIIELIEDKHPPREFTTIYRFRNCQSAAIAKFDPQAHDVSKWLSTRGIVRVTVCQPCNPDILKLRPLKPERCTNVSIVIQGRSFTTHKNVLIKHSKYFESLFKDNLSEYMLDTICPKSFIIIRDFMYSNVLPEKKSVNYDVLEVACVLELEEKVIQHCEHIVCSKMTVQNCVQCSMIAFKWNLKLLKNYSTKFIADHLRDVLNCENWKVLVEEYPEILPDLFTEKLRSFK